MIPTSVVIPTYNRAGLVAETIEAVLAQSQPAHEIIVVDDGSTDETAAVLRGFGQRITPVRVDNGGDLVARNVGLRRATGRLVAFCDSDDLWTPGFLATMAAAWHWEDGLTACFSDFRILQDGVLSAATKLQGAPAGFWDGWQALGPDTAMFTGGFVTQLLAFQPLFPSCMVVDREAFASAGGWDEGVSRIVGCDFATALRVAALPPIGIVRRPLAAVRKHASNISRDAERMNLGDAEVLDYVLRTRPELQPLADAIHASTARRRSDALDSAFSRRDFPAVQRIYGLLPAGARGRKQRAKAAIASLPRPLANTAASLFSR